MDAHEYLLVLRVPFSPQDPGPHQGPAARENRSKGNCLVRNLRAHLGGLLLAGAVAGFAADRDWEINVVGDLTEAGRKLTPASRDHPAIYVPVVVGHREEGDLRAGEKPPPPQDEILRQLARALAAQGYVVAGAGKPEPALLLLFSWGSLNPTFDPLDVEYVNNLGPTATTETASLQTIANSREMRALVAGNTTRNMPEVPAQMTNQSLADVRSDMLDDRYFVTVVAFDWAAAKAHKKVILWGTKMSVPSRRVTLADVVPALIKTGGPFFGRETAQPQRLAVPAARDGQVEVGAPTVVPPAGENSVIPARDGDKR